MTNVSFDLLIGVVRKPARVSYGSLFDGEGLALEGARGWVAWKLMLWIETDLTGTNS